MHRWPMPRAIDENLVLIVQKLDNLVHEWPHRRKPEGVDVPCGRSQMTKKVDAECASATPLLRDGPILAADFDLSEWEIMYPHFVEEGLVDPPGHVNKKNV
jgi:hypothetical protein